MQSLRGISHITFLVRDLASMSRFLCEGLGASQVYDSGDAGFSVAPERFFVLGGVWIAAMQGEPPAPSYAHVAFSVDESDLPLYEARLRRLGLTVKAGRSRVDGEGASLYVRDFDGHLFELHTGSLQMRLDRYRSGASLTVDSSVAVD